MERIPYGFSFENIRGYLIIKIWQRRNTRVCNNTKVRAVSWLKIDKNRLIISFYRDNIVVLDGYFLNDLRRFFVLFLIFLRFNLRSICRNSNHFEWNCSGWNSIFIPTRVLLIAIRTRICVFFALRLISFLISVFKSPRFRVSLHRMKNLMKWILFRGDFFFLPINDNSSVW